MNLREEGRVFGIILAVFLGVYFLPVGAPHFEKAVLEALYLARDYAREHVVLCLIPAFFIAGAMAVYISQGAVMRYLGAGANKCAAYGVAAVSGAVLAVCSCTVLPLFAGIYRMGAGLGPAVAFLYAGPAINVMAVILTARVLGADLGLARAIGAVLFSIVIGLIMQALYRGEKRTDVLPAISGAEGSAARTLGQTIIFFAAMIGVLVFANVSGPQESGGVSSVLFEYKWAVTGFFAVSLGVVLVRWFGIGLWKMLLLGLAVALSGLVSADAAFIAGLGGLALLIGTDKGENTKWLDASWGFAKQILPLLLAGILVAGFLLGRPDHEGLIPMRWIESLVGGNTIGANLFAAVAGAFMYFATLTEVPIVQGLIENGMGKGPALALLLAGPALSLPNMLVIRSVLGTQKTIVYTGLVIIMASASGLLFGAYFA